MDAVFQRNPSEAGSVTQQRRLVRALPGEFRELAAEMAVGGRFAVDRAHQVEHPGDAVRAQVEVLAHQAHDARVRAGLGPGRGAQIEAKLGGNLPAAFPVIDRFAGGVATSIKSVDLAALTYQDAAALGRTLAGYVDRLDAFQGAARGGVEVTGEMIKEKVLQVAVPSLDFTKTQLDAFLQAAEYAGQRGIRFTITVVR